MSSDADRAWGWTAALLDGSTVPWERWQTVGPAMARVLPGAQQLELLRLLNGLGPVPRDLAERVVHAVPTGRGSAEYVVDGARVPARELVRLVGGVLAEALAERRAGPATPSPARLAAPALARPALRTWLAAEHEALRLSPRTVVVAGADPARMVDLVWGSRALVGRGPGFSAFWTAATTSDQPPPRADLAGLVRDWADRAGARHVVLLAEPPAPASLSPTGVAALRSVAAPLRLLARPPRSRRLLTTQLLPVLEDVAGRAVGVTPTTVAGHAWLLERGARLHTRLERAVAETGVRVVGDLAALAPSPERLQIGSEPRPRDVLTTAAHALLALEGAGDEDGNGEGTA